MREYFLDVSTVLIRDVLHRDQSVLQRDYVRANFLLWIDPLETARSELCGVVELVELVDREIHVSGRHRREQPSLENALHKMLDHELLNRAIKLSILDCALANRTVARLRQII